MRRFGSNEPKKNLPPVDVHLDEAPVYFIGPATQQNPMTQMQTRLMGKVFFHDPKIKWNRITLQFTGKASINIRVPATTLPKDVAGDLEDDESMHLQSTVPICQVEKELIFTGEPTIEFGLHLPAHLPPSIKAKHASVEYTLVANFSGGSFFKKYRIQRSVTVCRHYLPNASAMIPCVEYTGAREWFEWAVEAPKAVAIASGEVVVALRWSVEKELVEVDRVEMALEEIETYRFSTKSGIHNLPATVSRFPATTYQPSPLSSSSDTHFIRTPIPLSTPIQPIARPIRTHHFDPFLELSHRIRILVYFSDPSFKPLSLDFPIIVTDYPPNADGSPSCDQSINRIISPGGDEATYVDLDLPEYTPRYET